jgi:hypothetical protein
MRWYGPKVLRITMQALHMHEPKATPRQRRAKAYELIG